MIERALEAWIKSRLFDHKAIVLTGPRQVGKSTLIKSILKKYNNVLFLDGDDPAVHRLLDRPNTEQIRDILGNSQIVFIDESQRINEIGLTSKIIVDQFPNVQLILSGSSSFELKNRTNEPLTGRKWSTSLWPVSWSEWQNYAGFVKAEQDLDNRLVYGFYPDVLMHLERAGEVLMELTDIYLYKDIMMLSQIRKSDEVRKLVQALAWQVGNEVSYAELSQTCNIDAKTVANYIDILEKAFIVFRLSSFSRNLRNEIKEGRKIYFHDNGIRNAVIGQLQPLALRQDVGALWENFLMSERIKQLSYAKSVANSYFWRTTAQQEVDYVEEFHGKIYGFEFKWNPKRTKSLPTTFTKNYQSVNKTITRDNFRDFVMPKSVADY